ncbi:MAG: argininosuccinate lyase [Proteobacteria bacterium]|nr:argininosuccinate lyase [Pseudomonadota bacterium]MBU1737513.1 argininosuccinate lyase [Pseudomonadota bacterium]
MSDKLWGGRFSSRTAASVESFTASIDYDARLYRHDIMGSIAHARMLGRQGLISNEESSRIIAGLQEIEKEIEEGRFTFRPELEDIHMNIEKALVEKIGPAGMKLHTARSRNDQVALDIRLYLRDVIAEQTDLLIALQKAFVQLARKNLGVIMPGYTHLQRAQPVLLSHHLLAYFEMFGRDRQRLADCLKRVNIMPLGSAALAGTGLPIDRESVAAELGFPAVTANSMDTVGDRDFAIEFASAAALIQIHLSRLSEELVLWSSEEFSFVRLADSYCTGSSIMPQKKNPDIPELVRGKTGRVTGNLVSLLTIMKGLPLTYNRDLQEDKEPLFDTIDTVSACLSITAEMLNHTEFNTARLANAVSGGGYMTATDMADYLVGKNIPFREAHSIVGKSVAYCIDQGKDLTDLTLDELRVFSADIDEDIFVLLTVEGSVNSRTSTGGTSTSRVEKAVADAEKSLGL